MTTDTTEPFSETSDFELLADPDRQFPVTIEVTEVYVVWVDADSQEDAHQTVKSYPEEWLERERPVEGWVSDVRHPNPWDVDESNSYHGHRDHGPWRFGEPHTYGMTALYREECIAAAMAKGLPTREPLGASS